MKYMQHFYLKQAIIQTYTQKSPGWDGGQLRDDYRC